MKSAFPELSREELEALTLRQNEKVAALLEALENTLSWLTSYPGGGAMGAYDKARAAIEQARS